MKQTQFKFEPGYVTSLREELNRHDLPTLFLPKDQLVALVSMPDSNPLEHVESVPIDAVEELHYGEPFGFCQFQQSPLANPLHYQVRDNHISVGALINRHRQRDWLPVGDHGPKFAPDMSMMLEGNEPILVHTGTGTLFDLVARERDKSLDCYVISFGTGPYGSAEVLDALVAEHRKSDAPVTALVRETTGAALGEPILVSTGSGSCLMDPRDIQEIPRGRHLISTNVYVISSEAFNSGIKWRYRRRRYHHNNTIWYQYERDIEQITEQYQTNYVQF